MRRRKYPLKRPRESLQRYCTVQVACDGNVLQSDAMACHRCQERLKQRVAATSKELRGERCAAACETRDATRVRRKSAPLERKPPAL